MIENRHNFSRLIIHYGIFWFHVILLSSSVNGQRSTGSQQNQYGLYSSFDPTIALVIVVLFCAFFFVGLISLFIRQCSEQRIFANLPAAAAATAGNRLRRTGLDPAVIEKFPMFFYSEVKDIKIGRETLECVVCLSEFEDDETLRLLPKCNHVFHPPCIDKWLASHVTCPVCRAKVTQESGVIPKNSPQETTTESSQEDSAPSPSQISNEVVITIIEERNRDSTESGAAIVTNTSQTKNRPLRPNISGRFPRSHSTGHSLVQAGGNIERYTLKLPEEVRTRIIASTKLERTLSFNVTSTKEWSVKKGYRGSGGGEGSSRGKQIGWSDRWSMLINRPFVSGGGAVKCSKIDNELGDSDSVSGRNLLASVKLNCLNLKGDGVEEASTRARPFI